MHRKTKNTKDQNIYFHTCFQRKQKSTCRKGCDNQNKSKNAPNRTVRKKKRSESITATEDLQLYPVVESTTTYNDDDDNNNNHYYYNKHTIQEETTTNHGRR
jgi:hypothetical protein